ncbi:MULTISPECIES: phosphogluconate dehydrogenase (NAD(+)-dependent, decarboxylating) [Cobetia]|uniref:Decarboxylating 6-phosphogluconate dehydrogenase n=1 Tax=Cobetia crustatorum TaxID=553385 RepID=A0A558HUK6_9GAMM|nr:MULTISPECIES: decarboxylating 6-phosphogluconate dehydrogenase [Cobetia]TVU72813.1 decarboxylating 6-phosphogluconate dehydrogenase [Cobetia crustatorum]
MQLGIIGLGRMGGNIARRLMRNGHEVVAHDRDATIAQSLVADGATHVESLAQLVEQIDAPRAIWVMLPSGEITEQTIAALADIMEAGDTIIDGGNTFYKDDVRRAASLKEKGLHYVDVGTSGGVWGLERGYCMMIGAEKEVFDHLEPLFDTLAPGYGDLERTKGRNAPDERAERGYIHAGPVGAGHYVKMVHNGIEYGLMQAYAEGFELMQSKGSADLPEDQRFDLNMADIAEVWRRGSVVSSWLLDLTAQALAGDERLDHYSGAVSDSGEGRWTVDAAVEQGVAVPVLANALFSRFSSRKENTYANRLLSAMRFGFGGHVEPPRQD